MGNLGYSFIPYHPGELLKDELACRNISQRSFALKLGLSYTLFNEVLNGKRPVSTDFALLIESALGINADLLVRMQTRYNMQVARADSNLKKRLVEVQKVCAILYL
jgi:addiction module HigA family antidote